MSSSHILLHIAMKTCHDYVMNAQQESIQVQIQWEQTFGSVPVPANQTLITRAINVSEAVSNDFEVIFGYVSPPFVMGQDPEEVRAQVANSQLFVQRTGHLLMSADALRALHAAIGQVLGQVESQ